MFEAFHLRASHTPEKTVRVTPSQKFQEKNIIQKIRGISNFIHPHHSKNQPHPGYPASKPETSEFPAVQATWKRTVSLRPGGSLSVNQPAVERLPTMHPRIITTIPVPWWFGNTITPVLGRTPPPNPRYDVIILSDPKAFSRSRCLGALLPAPWKNTIPRVLKLHENARSFEGLVVVCVFLSRVWCWCCSCLFWSFLSCAVVAFLPSAFFCPLVFLLFCFAPLFCSSPPLVSSSALLLCSSALLWLALLCSHWFSINLNYSSMLSHLLPDHPSKF